MNRVFAKLMLPAIFVGVLACAGCDAPKEQKEWGAREGGLNLPPKQGSEREVQEAEAAAAAARRAADAKELQRKRLEDRKGGLNLAPKGDSEKPKK